MGRFWGASTDVSVHPLPLDSPTASRGKHRWLKKSTRGESALDEPATMVQPTTDHSFTRPDEPAVAEAFTASDDAGTPRRMEAPTVEHSYAPTAFSHRPDLDGLRCVAVAAVILFHTTESWLPGGFIGVDVFIYFILKKMCRVLVRVSALV